MIAELQRVTKTYGSVVALDCLSLEFEAGRATAIRGPNGAGKTTAVKLLLGLTRPTRGTVALFGADPRSPAARRRTGVILQIRQGHGPQLPFRIDRQARPRNRVEAARTARQKGWL
jgi:ABC-2 type transport system ATP-binding protein